MRSLVEYQFYQRIVSGLDFGWMPETYYTFVPGHEKPSYRVSEELIEVCEPYIGAPISDFTRRSMQAKIDGILRDYEIRRHVLIWVDALYTPSVIDWANVVQSGDYAYAIRPYQDRAAIMQELMAQLEKRNG